MHHPWLHPRDKQCKPETIWLTLLFVFSQAMVASSAQAGSADDKIDAPPSRRSGNEPSAGQMRPPLPTASTQGSRTLLLKPGSIRGAFVLKSGSRFPVAILNELNSDTAKSGEAIEAMLMVPLEYGGVILAPQGARIRGRVSNIVGQRSSLGAKLSSRNWLNASAAFTICFQEISCAGKQIAICAQPAPDTVVFSNNEDLPLKVNKSGLIVLPFNGAPHIATSVAISGISFASGPFSLITGPVLSTAASIVSPSFGLDRPVPNATAAERLRAAATGAVKGLPGGFLVSGMVNRGLDFRIPAGTDMTVELTQDLVIDTTTGR